MQKDKKKQIDICLKNIAKGRTEYVSTLYELVQANLLFLAFKYLKAEFKANDLMSDFWFDIVKISKKYVRPINAYGYLCKVVKNMALMRLRSEGRREKFETELRGELLDEYEAIPFDVLIQSEENRRLNESFKKGISTLSEAEKVIFYLANWEEKTIRECAKEMGISKSAAGRLKASATEKLKISLKNDGWDKNDV